MPTDIVFSLTGFQQRGGGTDDHADGWGIAFYEGKGCRLFLDPVAAAHSPVAEFVRHYPIRSLNVVAHIRKATRGPVGLENTHPFQRELWGSYWVFAHNGTLDNYRPTAAITTDPSARLTARRRFVNCWKLYAAASHPEHRIRPHSWSRSRLGQRALRITASSISCCAPARD